MLKSGETPGEAPGIERPRALEPLVARLERLGAGRERVMLGIVGAPGAGKSTLAAGLVAALPAGEAALVPMDGFHLAAEVLAGTELQQRRGAVDTYDAYGFRDLLRRLHARDEPVVYAPRYERAIEDPIASALPIPATARYLVVEGNWLLADFPGWREARAHLDEVWFVDVDAELRHSRLIARHVQFGKSPDEARHWSLGSDEVNARLIETGRPAADLVVNVQDVAELGGPR